MRTHWFELTDLPENALTPAEMELIKNEPSTLEERAAWWALVVKPRGTISTPPGDYELAVVRAGKGTLKSYLWEFLTEVSEDQVARTGFWQTLTDLLALILSDAMIQRKEYAKHPGWSSQKKSEMVGRYDLTEIFQIGDPYAWRGIRHQDTQLVAGRLLEYKFRDLAPLIPPPIQARLDRLRRD